MYIIYTAGKIGEFEERYENVRHIDDVQEVRKIIKNFKPERKHIYTNHYSLSKKRKWMLG